MRRPTRLIKDLTQHKKYAKVAHYIVDLELTLLAAEKYAAKHAEMYVEMQNRIIQFPSCKKQL